MCKHASYALTCFACMPDDLAAIYRQAKRDYYAGTPTLTDTAFDWLEQKIRTLAPDHPCLQEVGSDT